MMRRNFLFIAVLVLLWSCGDSIAEQEPLSKLPSRDLITLIKDNQWPSLDSVRIKDMHGHLISVDSLKALQITGMYFADFYLNKAGKIVETRLRPITDEDKDLMNGNYPPRIFEVDCSQQEILLEQVLKRDQEVRTNGIISDFNANRENLELVISVIERCGMPTLEEVDSLHMEAIWQIFQHAASQKYRKKYFKHLKSAARRGDLNPAEVANMEDRILVADGQPQRYGTYLIHDRDTRTLSLYDLEAPEKVDARRATVGLGPISEFLIEYGIEFQVPQIQ